MYCCGGVFEKNRKGEKKYEPPVDIKDIKDFTYITSRKLLNEQGEKCGEVFMWRRKGE